MDVVALQYLSVAIVAGAMDDSNKREWLGGETNALAFRWPQRCRAQSVQDLVRQGCQGILSLGTVLPAYRIILVPAAVECFLDGFGQSNTIQHPHGDCHRHTMAVEE